MSNTIAGVLPVVHMPFDEHDCVDYATLARELDWAFEQGADGVATGMVSELIRLTPDERKELTRQLVPLVAGRGLIVASVGAESTRQAVRLACEAEQAGCHAIMAIPPTSAALPEPQLVQYFAALADAVPLPLIVQDASAYVGRAIPLSACVTLIERYGPEKILFKPEANPVGPNLSLLREATAGEGARVRRIRRDLPRRQLSPGNRRYDSRNGSARWNRGPLARTSGR